MECKANKITKLLIEFEIRKDVQILGDDLNVGYEIPSVATSHSVHIMGHCTLNYPYPCSLTTKLFKGS